MNSIKPYAGPLDNLEGKIRGDVCVKVLAALRSAELMKAAAGGDIKLKIGNHILNQSSADDLITFFRYLLAVCIADKTPVPEGEGGPQRFENAVKTVGTLARLLANSKNGSQKERELLKKLFDVIPEAKTYKNVSNYIDRANDEKFEKLEIGTKGNVKRVAERFFLKLNEPNVHGIRANNPNKNSSFIERAVNRLFTSPRTKFRGLGVASMIGTQFKLNGNRQSFPNPGTPEFQQMINEIGKRDISNLNGGQEQVARVRLSALAKIANKNDIIRKIRNGANTTRITPTETANLRKAIRKAIKGEPLKNLFNGINENTTEAKRLEDIAIALGPSPGNVAIARVNSAMRRQKNPSV